MNTGSNATRVKALFQQGGALLAQGRPAEAARAYRELVALDAGHADAWYNLGYALKACGCFDDALDAYDHALQARVADPQEVHLNRAAIYSDHLRRPDLAEAELDRALALRPGYLPAHLNLGNLHEEQGRRDAAVRCYEAILADPGGAAEYRHEAMARLAHLQPPERADAPMLGELRQAAMASRDPLTRANLWFALGRAYERLHCTAPAFDAFTQANDSARRAGPAYDRGRQEQFIDALIRCFDVPSTPTVSEASPAPLFICGMFRSGSTLLEQVLAAHPGIRAGGELEWLQRLVRGPLAPFPASVAGLTTERLGAMADDYRAQLQRLFPDAGDARYITDKRPDNFLLIGLIKRLFPCARILHTVRHPLDTGLSVYMQHLAPGVAPYAGTLADIGHYFAQYRRLMAHWKRLYPQDIHDVDYDRLVRDPRAELEPALAFLGLDWHPDCLQFHRLGNVVKTASYWQVRQPLYGDASGRWQRYGECLAPLRSELERAGIDLG